MEEIVIFSDWEFFQCLHHLGKLKLVEDLPYKCVLLEDLFLEDTPYSKQAQLEEEIKTLSNVSIDKPKNPKFNNIYDPDSEISLIDQYAFILGTEYKNIYANSNILVCIKFSKYSHECVDLFDIDTLYSESLIYSLKRSKTLDLDELNKIVSLVKNEHLRDKEYEKYLNALVV